MFPLVRASAIVVAALLLPAASAAQTATEVRRPYRSLFGGDPRDSAASSLTVSLFGGYDDNGLRSERAEVDPRFDENTAMGGAAATLTLQHAGEKASFGLNASSALRYYSNQEDFTAVAYGASAFADLRPAERTSVNLLGGFVWTPLYSPVLSWSGAGADGSQMLSPMQMGGDYAVGDRPATFWNASVNVTHAITRRASLMGGYSLQHADYSDDGRQQRSDTIRGGASYRVTRYSSLRFGYRRTDYRYGSGEARRGIHDFSGGIDYSRPFSVSGRRTTFTVTPGWAVEKRNGDLQFHATGSATLNHEMGRTWTARAGYHRGFNFVEGLEVEMLANSAMASLEGLLSRRVSVDFGVNLSVSDKSSGSAEYETYSGGARISYALNRHIAAFAQYIYFSYRFDDTVDLPLYVGRRLDRQGVRVGITLWAPVLR